MNNPHFYKANSRLGMMNIPNEGTELNIGVEEGPEAVLTTDFLKHYPDAQTTTYTFTLPEVVNPQIYQDTIAEESHEFAELINQTLRPGETQVVVGGDHSVAFGSLLAVLSRMNPKTVGYIQFDSHGDLHLWNTSPSGNFHGMWLRPFADHFDSPPIAKIARFALRPKQMLFIGNLELEPEELRFFAENQITRISSNDLAANRQQTLSSIGQFARRFNQLHISFDVDVFHRDYVDATGTPAKNGFQPDDIFDIIEVLDPAHSKSMDLVEVNPRKAKSEQTVKMAQAVLLRFCKSIKA